jgi:hypothetical protein
VKAAEPYLCVHDERCVEREPEYERVVRRLVARQQHVSPHPDIHLRERARHTLALRLRVRQQQGRRGHTASTMMPSSTLYAGTVGSSQAVLCSSSIGAWHSGALHTCARTDTHAHAHTHAHTTSINTRVTV